MIVGALALVLGGCLQRTAERSPAVSTCNAVASQPWRPLSGVEFTIEASARGPDCAHAVATMAIRAPDSTVLWAEAAPTAHVMTLASAQNTPAMESALADWVNSTNNTMATTSALPDWPQNADGPVSGEFPFYVEPHWDRAAYLELRGQDAPLYCYVQGMESQACLALRDGRLDKVGVQSFPG
jgi:hypothetical protein